MCEIESDKLSELQVGGASLPPTDGKTEVWRQGLCYWQADSLGCLKYSKMSWHLICTYILGIYLTYIVHSKSVENIYGVINRKRILGFYFLMCAVCGHLCPRAHTHTQLNLLVSFW